MNRNLRLRPPALICLMIVFALRLSAQILSEVPSRPSLEFHVASLSYFDADGPVIGGGNAGTDLARILRRENINREIRFRSAAEADFPPPAGFLEAAACSARAGGEYLLYGYIRESAYAREGEIKLFDHETGRILTSFYAKDSRDEYERFLTDLGRKIIEFIYTDLGFDPRTEISPPARNVLSLPFYLGPWFQSGGNESGTLSGILRVESGLLLTPVSPQRRGGTMSRELQTGVLAAWALAVSRASYESFLLHRFRFSLPLIAVQYLADGSRLSAGIAPGFQVDWLVQDRVYSGRHEELHSVPALTLSVDWSRPLSKHLSMGVRTALEFEAYRGSGARVVPSVFAAYEFHRS
jgi:hypothetical protein